MTSPLAPDSAAFTRLLAAPYLEWPNAAHRCHHLVTGHAATRYKWGTAFLSALRHINGALLGAVIPLRCRLGAMATRSLSAALGPCSGSWQAARVALSQEHLFGMGDPAAGVPSASLAASKPPAAGNTMVHSTGTSCI